MGFYWILSKFLAHILISTRQKPWFCIGSIMIYPFQIISAAGAGPLMIGSKTGGTSIEAQ